MPGIAGAAEVAQLRCIHIGDVPGESHILEWFHALSKWFDNWTIAQDSDIA